jgi:hypothetical protein
MRSETANLVYHSRVFLTMVVPREAASGLFDYEITYWRMFQHNFSLVQFAILNLQLSICNKKYLANCPHPNPLPKGEGTSVMCFIQSPLSAAPRPIRRCRRAG